MALQQTTDLTLAFQKLVDLSKIHFTTARKIVRIDEWHATYLDLNPEAGPPRLSCHPRYLNKIASTNPGAIQPEEEIMLTVDIPYIPIETSSAVLVAQARSGQAAAKPPRSVVAKTPREEVMEYCQDVDHTFKDSAFNSLPVLQGILSRLGYRMSNSQPDFNAPPDVLESVRNSKVTIIETPQHGSVSRLAPDSYFWQYTAHTKYEGKDKVVFLVEWQGRRFKITANLLVHYLVDEYANPPDCEKAFRKEPASKPSSSNAAPIFDALSAVTLKVANLDGGSLAQTTGTTLSPTDAGHGWFIDPTPNTNEEFLPTSCHGSA